MCAVMLVTFCALPLAAQAPKEEPQTSIYRLEYTLIELDNGKRTNSRQYTMHIDDQGGSQVRSIFRVPVRTKELETVYIDVGLKIDGGITRRGNQEVVVSTIEMSSFVENLPSGVSATNPVFKTVSARASTSLAAAKPVAIASIDEFDSTRRYEVQLQIVRLQ